MLPSLSLHSLCETARVRWRRIKIQTVRSIRAADHGGINDAAAAAIRILDPSA